jgi:hypothetical protein
MPVLRGRNWFFVLAALSAVVFAPELASAQATFEVQPSVTTSTLGAAVNTLDLGVSCVDANGIIPNCDMRITHRAVPYSGGHGHDDPSRPIGSFSPDRVNTGPTGRVKVTYTAPEPAGVIDVTLSGTTQDGTEVIPAVFTIGVETDGFSSFPVPWDGMSVSASTLHENNRAATPFVISKLLLVGAGFRFRLEEQNVPPDSIPEIVLTGLSLPKGGIFDVDANGDGAIDNLWRPPHRSHRFGRDVDVRIRNIPRQYRDELGWIIRQQGFAFPVQSERPENPTSSHWHLRFP